MTKLTGTFTAIIAALGIAFAIVPNANASTYTSIGDWNAATGMNFSVTAGSGFDFFGACPFGSGPCAPNPALVGPPTADNANTQTTQDFINANTTWNVTLVADARQGAVLGEEKSGTLTSGNIAYALWALKADNFLIALLFDTPVSSITIAGLSHALSHFDLGNPGTNPVPLPGAALLFGTVLAGAAFIKRRRKQAVGTAAA